jgi:glycosyltransferase involved in cell wall biosynthesis
MAFEPRSERPDGLPTVTVLIPTFDRARFLDEAIGSVLEQDYEDLELIVLDDGSTDETPSVLKRFAESHPERFRWTRHDNMGQARTLNRGFEMADGEIVGYLSSDDALLPGAVSKLAAVFAAEPEVVVAYPAWEYIDEDGESIDSVMPVEFTLAHAVRMNDPVIGPGGLMRRSVVDEVGGWDPEIRYSADFEFWLRVSRLGPFRRVPETLSLYRWHAGMAGRSNEEGFRIAMERVAIVDRLFSAPDVPAELLEVRDEAYRSAFLAGAGLLGGNAPWERFFVADRLMSSTFGTHADHLPTRSARLRARVADLEQELETLAAQIAALGDSLARREIEIGEVDAQE